LSDFYEKRAAEYEKRWQDEIAAGKIVRAERDEARRLLRLAEATRMEVDRVHAEAGAPYGTPADTRELVKRVIASCDGDGHTSVPQTFWVLKHQSGLYMRDGQGGPVSKPLDAAAFHVKPVAPSDYKVMRVCVYEEED
jgi:hypothetical protein